MGIKMRHATRAHRNHYPPHDQRQTVSKTGRLQPGSIQNPDGTCRTMLFNSQQRPLSLLVVTPSLSDIIGLASELCLGATKCCTIIGYKTYTSEPEIYVYVTYLYITYIIL